ncbi:MAG: sigma-70 family RNA polymerase sigma factor [Oscillibacter sp.]|nr:sigma-70 family RNA polymerase sigma factor [Oscillibacter sp.]
MKRINRVISDRELLMAYNQKKDKGYWGVLYERYVPMVYGVALKYLKRPEDAQRIVMYLFDELSDKVTITPVDEFKFWLYTHVRSCCLKELRRRSSDGISVSLDEEVLEFCDDFNLDAVRKEIANEKILQKCIEALPEKQRISVCRFFMEGRSYKEIEDATGFPLKLIKSLVQNGKRNLKLCLGKKGIA